MAKKNEEMQKYEPQALAKAERSLSALTKLYPEGDWNLLVPKMMTSELPAGTRLVATRIDISANVKDGDVYQVPFGKLGVGKAKLNQISKALGADWIESKRTDDRKHPHYIEWQVVGRFTQPDGSVFTERATKTLDLRVDIGDGTPGADMQEIQRTAAKKNRDPIDEITKVRQNIQTLAETKAKNRAIRAAAGMQTSYTAQQLKKPFLAVKLAIDPQSELGSRTVVAQLAGATGALYGPPPEVIDATFEEPTVDAEQPPAETDGEEEAAGNGVPQAASSDTEEPPHEADAVRKRGGWKQAVADIEAHQSPDAGEPPHEAETGEATGTEEVFIKLATIWQKVQSVGMKPTAFKTLAETVTGKQRKEDMTLSDAKSIEDAAEEFLAEKGNPL